MPSRTAPHCPSASMPHVPCTIHPSVHFSTPHCFLSWPQLPTLSPTRSILLPFHHHPHAPAPTCPGSLCHLHGLVDPSLPSLSPARFPLFPGALSRLTHSGSSCPQDPHSPPQGPLRACCLSSCCLFISAHSCSHVGLFLGGTEPFCTAAPGRAGGSEREHNQETEESEVVRGLLGPGAWESRGM